MTIVHSTNYACFVYSNLIPLEIDGNSCSFTPQKPSQQCSSMQNCLNGFQLLNLTVNDELSIYLMNEKYDDEGCCNLVIDFPAQLMISKLETLKYGSLINCQQEPSFISSLRSNLVIFGLGVEGVTDTAIVVPQSNTVITLAIQQSYFQNCQGQKGGAISLDYPNSLTITNTTFYNNTAQYGGAIYAQNAGITDCTFTSNKATMGGGAIFSNSVTLGSCIFSSNSADEGGAVNSNEVHTQHSIFKNNYAATSGGALFVSLLNSNLTNYFGNQAQYGGAITLYSADQLNLLNYASISNNYATEEGGAIFITQGDDGGSLDLTHTKIFENAANQSGGAIFFNQTLVSFVSGGSIYNNSVGSDSSSSGSGSGSDSTSASSMAYYEPSSEIGCHNNDTMDCNLCQNYNCTQCKAMDGNCIYQNNATYCLLPKTCLYGSCIISLEGEYSCKCDEGYIDSQCTQNKNGNNNDSSNSNSNSSGGDKHNHQSTDSKKNNTLLKLEIALPIVFGCLIVVFIVTIILMIRRKKQTHSYQQIN